VICLQRDLVPILAGLEAVLQIGCDLKGVFIGKFFPVFEFMGREKNDLSVAAKKPIEEL